MKRLLFLICGVLMSMLLVSAGFAPVTQAARDDNRVEQNIEPGNLASGCPIDWKPSVLMPVVSYAKSYDQTAGAPGPVDVYYPTALRVLDKPSTELIDCGQYPLVIFLHGHRTGDLDIYKRWNRLPSELARSGYVVVVPRLPNIASGLSPWSPGGDSDLDLAKAVVTWMQTGWEYHANLASSPRPAVVGHSFGALLGARLVPQIGASAYVSLSGGWLLFDEAQWKTLDALTVPSFFAWGSHQDGYAKITDVPAVWNRINTVKHKWIFERGNHWDYLYPHELPGAYPGDWGSCNLVAKLAIDYTALFLSRHIPPPGAGIEGLIPPSLTPPSVARTDIQNFYTPGHLDGIKNLPSAGGTCGFISKLEEPTNPFGVADMTFPWVDRLLPVSPEASTLPTVAVIPGLHTYNIAYGDEDGHLHELWRDLNGVGTTDLTNNAQAPKNDGVPFAYVDTLRNTEILLYHDEDGTVRSLYWSTGAVGHDNLGDTAHAPKADSDPIGYYDAARDTHHVIYRTSDGHLHELWWQGVEPVRYGGDLTALASAPKAVGQPSAFIDASGTNHVVYRSHNNEIRNLYWSNAGVSDENLSGVAGTPLADGDPVAFYTRHNDMHQVVYVGNDWHVYELYWPGVIAVAGRDLSVGLNAPVPGNALSAYYNPVTNTKHVVYNSSAFVGELHEIQWSQTGWIRAHTNISKAYKIPQPWDTPTGFVVAGATPERVAYLGTDGHIYEVILR